MLSATKFLEIHFYGPALQVPDVLTAQNHCCQNQNIPKRCDKDTMNIPDLFQIPPNFIFAVRSQFRISGLGTNYLAELFPLTAY